MGGRMQCMACRPHSDRCSASRPTCTGLALKLSGPPDGPDGAAVCEVGGVCTTGSPGTWSSWVLVTVDTWPAWQRSAAHDWPGSGAAKLLLWCRMQTVLCLNVTPGRLMLTQFVAGSGIAGVALAEEGISAGCLHIQHGMKCKQESTTTMRGYESMFALGNDGTCWLALLLTCGELLPVAAVSVGWSVPGCGPALLESVDWEALDGPVAGGGPASL